MERLTKFFEKRRSPYTILFAVGLWGVLCLMSIGLQSCGPDPIKTKERPKYRVGQYVYIYGAYKGIIRSIDTSGAYPNYLIDLPWTAVNVKIDSQLTPATESWSALEPYVQPTANLKQASDDFMNRDNYLTDNEQWVNAEMYNTDVMIQSMMTEFKYGNFENPEGGISYEPKELYARLKTLDSLYRLEKKRMANHLTDTEDDDQ